jgi:hypothetical protein
MFLYDWQAQDLLASKKAEVRCFLHIALLLCFSGSGLGNVQAAEDGGLLGT